MSTTTSASKDLFVGVGPAAEVDRYLDSVAIDEVTEIDFEPFKMHRLAHSGTQRAAAPTSQDFWVAHDIGRDAELDWKVRNGEYRMVLMNGDGTSGVDADGTFELELPHVNTIAWVLIGGGSLLALGGIIGVVLSVRRRS